MKGILPGIYDGIIAVLESRGWLEAIADNYDKVEIADAVRRFQQWIGLTPTGVLDEATIERLDAPRFCACPDRITLDATSLCKWSSGDIPFFVTQAFSGLTLSETWNLFDWALGEWAKVGKITPRRVTTINEARIVASNANIDGPNGVLAQSQLPCGAIVRASQQYDTSERWQDLDFARIVVLHELGHALGIDHNPVRGSIMSPYYDPALRTLQPWDIGEIRKRYGDPTPPVVPPVIPPAVNDAVMVLPSQKKIIVGTPGWTIEVRS